MIFQKLAFQSSVLCKWIPTYLAAQFRSHAKPVHVFFCMVDHYEPGTDGASPELEKKRMQDLLVRYPQLADRHRDAAGNRPPRTWFFPPHYHRRGNLKELVSLCEQGYGEVELHLHHGKTKPDTAEHLEHTIRLCVEEYSQFGIFGSEGGQKRYGFIHGDWALDNSRNGTFCGVNNEIDVLEKTGCYADFTFPCFNEANPAQQNSIYYAKEDGKPKSHNTGSVARVGDTSQEGLLMIQGPLHPILHQNGFLRVRACGDQVELGMPATKRRVNFWIRSWIHVQGKRDWVFVKVHTHGASDADLVLGSNMDETFSHLEQTYNDGSNYVLHYVTARELYNLAKAAEAGETGDPQQYRDYKVSAPSYDSSPDILDASEPLRDAVHETYRG